MDYLTTSNGVKIDEASQIILKILADYGGSLNVRKLRAESGLEQTGQIHYRVREYLGRPADDGVSDDAAGFIERDGVTEIDSQDVTVYRLTNEGREFLDENEDDVLDAKTAAEAVQEIQRMRDAMSEHQTRMDDLNGEVDRMDGLLNKRGTRLSRMQNELRDHADWLARLPESERVEEIEERVEYLENTVEELESQFVALEERVADLEG